MKQAKKKANKKANKKAKKKAKAKKPAATRAATPKKRPARASAARKVGQETETAKRAVVVPLKPRPASATPQTPSELIDQRILEVAGWRAETLARMRALIREAHPQVVEEWKWEVPVWSHDGIVCTGEVYQNVVKLTFAHGAAVPDPSNLFNSSLQGNTRRAIDIHEGDRVDGEAFKALFKAAAARNSAAKST
jgi:hypothetical protein